jgi:predicted O-methyltransferase YrrM
MKNRNEMTHDYMLDLTPERDPVVTEMEAIARERGFPIVGPLVGRILYQLTHITEASRIIELGSGFGYSTIWFARALPEDGEVIYTDMSQENYRMADDFFRRTGCADRIRMVSGNAIEILEKQEGEFDIVFNDIDKHQYPNVIPVALPKLRRGGLLITDNIFWDGRVVDGETDPDTSGVREYTRAVYENPSLFTTIVPVRDGISISLKVE